MLLLLAQTTAPPPQEIVQPQKVLPLPGKLDTIPTFNSNSPELILKEGILLSTFPPTGKKVPTAHLNFPFQGRFDIFAHHIAKAPTPDNLRTLYLGIILYNPTSQPVKVDVLQAASYLSQPDAPFIELPSYLDNLVGKVFAGPGSRVMNDVLRGQRQSIFPPQIVIPPQQSQMLLNLPIPVRELTPPLNGRSTLMRLRSHGRVYAASLAMFAPVENGKERPPTLTEWQNLLDNADVAGPRDRIPTPPDQTNTQIIYGRVSGVAQGTKWTALLVDRPTATHLTIPPAGQAISYALSTVPGGRLGTSQVQSAPLLVRYPDTAYSAHGNYGIQYSLQLPLANNTQNAQAVTVSIQTALKEDQLSKAGLRFLQPPNPQVFFRGTVRVRYNNNQGQPQTKFVHLAQRRGQQGEPLVVLNMQPNDTRLVEVDFLYPPDATPPQVLTITTLLTDK